MAKEVILPKLGQTMEEGTVVKWLKKEGDSVKKGDILLEIQTDKAVLEVESFAEGTLLKALAKEGDVVPVLQVIGYVGKTGEKLPETKAAPKAETPKTEAPPKPVAVEKKAAPAVVAAPAPVISSVPTPAPMPVPAAAPAVSSGRLLISPRARKLVNESVINPRKISGSGPEGRIVEKDVLAYLEQAGYYDLKITPTAKILAREHNIDITEIKGSGPGGRVGKADVLKAQREKPKTLSQMRGIIARRMSQSALNVPHFFSTAVVDMTPIVELRTRLKKSDPDLKISFNDFVVSAVAQPLREFPLVNSVCFGDTYTTHEEINVGVAVSLDDGLIVPVIRNADRKKLSQIGQEGRELAEKARSKKLTPEEYTGGTFTVSNMGMLGVESFTAIINPGEGAILAVGAIQPTPMAVNGDIKVRSIMKMTLSSDHRIIDGATAASFMAVLKEKLETSNWKI